MCCYVLAPAARLINAKTYAISCLHFSTIYPRLNAVCDTACRFSLEESSLGELMI